VQNLFGGCEPFLLSETCLQFWFQIIKYGPRMIVDDKLGPCLKLVSFCWQTSTHFWPWHTSHKTRCTKMAHAQFHYYNVLNSFWWHVMLPHNSQNVSLLSPNSPALHFTVLINVKAVLRLPLLALPTNFMFPFNKVTLSSENCTYAHYCTSTSVLQYLEHLSAFLSFK
jgi:hypothetical protein